jgi:hypothetical protein
MQKLALVVPLVAACVPVTTQLRAPLQLNAGTAVTAVSAADFNADGKLDLVVTKAASTATGGLLAPAEGEVTVMWGRGDGTFERGHSTVGHGQPRGATIADLNGDGRPDIVVAGLLGSDMRSGSLTIFFNKGDGTFHQGWTEIVGREPMHVRAADLNHDGKIDLAFTDYRPEGAGASEFMAGRVVTMINKGDGTFDAPLSFSFGRSAAGLAIADLSGDTHVDMAVPDELGASVHVLNGRGDGTFEERCRFSTPFRPSGISYADVNKDGRNDLLVGAPAGVMVYLSSGACFTHAGDYRLAETRSAYVADFDRDGNVDEVSGKRLLRGNGRGGFTLEALPDADYNDSFVTVGDFNGDGWADVVAADRAHNSVLVYLNKGSK